MRFYNAFRTLPSKSYASRLLLALTMTMTIGTARARKTRPTVMKINGRPRKMPPQTPMRGNSCGYAVEKGKPSGGRIKKLRFYPASQLGSIPRQ